jgi:hypothetical protein
VDPGFGDESAYAGDAQQHPFFGEFPKSAVGRHTRDFQLSYKLVFGRYPFTGAQ